MSEQKNNTFETDVIALLSDLKNSQEKQSSELINKVSNLEQYSARLEKRIVDLEQSLADVKQQATDIDTVMKIQDRDVSDIDNRVTGINTLIRWAALLIVGAVMVALLNLVIINDGDVQSTIPLPNPEAQSMEID